MLAVLSGATFPYIWTLRGAVLSGVAPDETNNVQEPTALYEGNPQILAGPNVFKLWYKSGWATPYLHYAESADGLTWTKYASNPLLSNVEQPFIFKDGATYHLYFILHDTVTRMDHYTSADGLSWTLAQASALTTGAGGAWDDEKLGNSCIWKEGASDWRMIYEACKTTDHIWKLGYATSSDGNSWSKSGSNPVVSETGSVGGPFVYKRAASDYWCWAHHSISGTVPTDLCRYLSSNLTTWTRNPISNTLVRGAGEGNSGSVGQLADPSIIEVSGTTYLFYGANADGSAATGHSQIKLATTARTMAQLVNTPEGV